jgi:hypothetical protein
MDEVLVNAPSISLTCQFNTVGIEIHCGDLYEAYVLFDDIAARLKRGEPITLSPNGKLREPHR